MSSRARITTLVAVAAAVIVAAVAALVFLNRPEEAPRPDPVAATVPVSLQADGAPEDLSLGVVLTFGQSGEPGSEYNRAAQGAVVAAQRFTQGGAPVTLETRNDRGTEDGAREAVRDLAGQGVSGIIVAGTGPQAQAAAKTAEELGLPAILPYASAAEPGPATWSTRASAASTEQALLTALAGKERILFVGDEGQVPPSVQFAQTLNLAEFEDVTALAQEAAVRTGNQPLPAAPDAPADAAVMMVAEPADAVVVSAATPQRLARLVQALQARDVSAPMILPDGAATPDFTSALAKLDGTVSGQLVTLAPAGGDAVALQQDAQGRGMSAFLSAVRLAAGNPEVRNLAGDGPFSAEAWAADAASHDAVVALVRAAALAGSGDPAEVGEALRTLALGPGEGLAGPALDFTRPDALTAAAVPVYASAQDLGLRPADAAAPRLVWIAATDAP